MRFEGRELKPHAEPISAAGLKEGSIYFAVNYLDDEMLIPNLEPLVFVGRNLDPSDTRQVYFQDIDSYGAGIRHDSVGSDVEARFWNGSENEVNHIFEYEQALDELMRCALRRGKAYGRR
jgi:hypothetical protein